MTDDAHDPVVSVIIPVRNDVVALRRCLAALAEQSYPRSRFEIIVVDDGSTRAVRDEIAEEQITVVRTARSGSYAARNAGEAAARGKILAFTDADCLPRADWIEQGVAAIESSGGGPIAGNVVLTTGEPPALAELHELHFGFQIERYVRDDRFGVTANLFVSRDRFLGVGRFHDGLESGGDLEFGWRAAWTGWPTRFGPDVVVSHPARRTWMELHRKFMRIRRGHLALGISPWGMLLADLTPPLAVFRLQSIAGSTRVRLFAFAWSLRVARLAATLPLLTGGLRREGDAR